MGDNPDMRDLLALRVQVTGYLRFWRVMVERGVEKANTEKPDLILMDMMMPVLTVGKRRGPPRLS